MGFRKGEALKEMDKLLQVDTEECLIWPGYVAPDGYGKLRDPETGGQYAHRYALIHTKGPGADGLEACHNPHCVSRACVNPRHLRWDTTIANQLDRHTSGTMKSTLSASDVQEIRRCIGSGELQHVIARRYGVNQSTISDIKRKKLWAWLAEEEVNQ